MPGRVRKKSQKAQDSAAQEAVFEGEDIKQIYVKRPRVEEVYQPPPVFVQQYAREPEPTVDPAASYVTHSPIAPAAVTEPAPVAVAPVAVETAPVEPAPVAIPEPAPVAAPEPVAAPAPAPFATPEPVAYDETE